MPKLRLDAIPESNATGYPPPYDAPMDRRHYRRLAPASGITDFGASHVRLEPGGISSQRHWHEGEDEMLVMLSGEAVLVDDHGRTPLAAGDVAAFPKGDGNGHHLVNEGDADCTFFVVGLPSASPCHYPDIDLHLPAGGPYSRKDGTPY
jgi:uncharacterized cupin superfamily protein